MTHIVFYDYPRNGEGLAVYDPDRDLYLYAPDTELVFHIGNTSAQLNNADLIRLRNELDAHLIRQVIAAQNRAQKADDTA